MIGTLIIESVWLAPSKAKQRLQVLAECSSGLSIVSNVLCFPSLSEILPTVIANPYMCSITQSFQSTLTYIISFSLEHHPGEFLCLCSHWGRPFQQSLNLYFPIIFSPKVAFIMISLWSWLHNIFSPPLHNYSSAIARHLPNIYILFSSLSLI